MYRYWLLDSTDVPTKFRKFDPVRENLTASEETAVRKTTPIPIELRCLYETFFRSNLRGLRRIKNETETTYSSKILHVSALLST